MSEVNKMHFYDVNDVGQVILKTENLMDSKSFCNFLDDCKVIAEHLSAKSGENRPTN